MVRADANGYTPRARLAELVIDRLNPRASFDDLVAQLLYEHVECYPGVVPRLEALVAAGESLVIVTNGESRQQRMKIRRTGLDNIVAGSVISGELGVKKPDARIFAAAREIAGGDGIVWMVGDHVEADIAGARTAGLATAWVSHGRSWPHPWTPTLTAPGAADALVLLNGELRSG